MKKFLKKRYIIPAAIALVLVIALIVGAVFVGDYYPATDRAVEAMTATEDTAVQVSVSTLADNATVFAPQNPSAALILYPGGKVDHVAYAPLAQALAHRGVLCVILEMPLRLAVFDMNAADGIREAVETKYPTVRECYIGGHSLGGSMAASYIGKHSTNFDGLVLLAAYSTADLSDTTLRVLSILGSEDGVLNREKYTSNRTNLPADFTEETIEGGNHAGFGDYGAQDGDGASTLADGEQIDRTAGIIAMFIHART